MEGWPIVLFRRDYPCPFGQPATVHIFGQGCEILVSKQDPAHVPAQGVELGMGNTVPVTGILQLSKHQMVGTGQWLCLGRG
jgi:hypothetical protein